MLSAAFSGHICKIHGLLEGMDTPVGKMSGATLATLTSKLTKLTSARRFLYGARDMMKPLISVSKTTNKQMIHNPILRKEVGEERHQEVLKFGREEQEGTINLGFELKLCK